MIAVHEGRQRVQSMPLVVRSPKADDAAAVGDRGHSGRTWEVCCRPAPVGIDDEGVVVGGAEADAHRGRHVDPAR